MNSKKWIKDKYFDNQAISYRIKKIIAEKRTKFQKVGIYDLYDYGISVFLDGIQQSAEKDELIYHECFIHPALILKNKINNLNLLLLGTGEGAALRELLKYKSFEKIYSIDVDFEAVQIFKENLKMMHKNSFLDKRVNFIYGNAGDFLKSNLDKFDIIYSDITDVDSFNLGSGETRRQKDFYKLVKSNLKKDGIFVMHTTELSEIQYKKHQKLEKVMEGIFKNTVSYRVFVPFFMCPWGFIIATDNTLLEVSKNKFCKFLKENNLNNLKFLNYKNFCSIFSPPFNIRNKV